ncbi:MAG: CPBP family intramembrane glutamic endopeptidase [Bacteroidales bacterium]|jgi:membrane protease YdiL (CAAX protease family)|nr:CPBP family intramembrane glutamic endopeptidase [Bacteroidales bacterium]
MNHLEASFTGKNSLWRYVVMVVSVFIVANTLGSLPLILAVTMKSVSDPGILEEMASRPTDLTLLGIDPLVAFAMMVFPFLTALLAYYLLIKPLNYRTFSLTLNGTNSIRWKKIFISALVWLILISVYLLVFLKIDPDNYSVNNTTSSLITLVVLSVVLIPFQAAFEEVVFRGYLMQGFTVLAGNRWLPVILTSVLFGLMHSFNPEVDDFGFWDMIPQYVLFGLIFGIITVLDDGIEAAIGAHAMNNIFLSVMVTHKSSVLQTPALYEQHNYLPWTEFAGLLIMGIIFILIMRRLYRWKDLSIIFRKVYPAPSEISVPSSLL